MRTPIQFRSILIHATRTLLGQWIRIVLKLAAGDPGAPVHAAWKTDGDILSGRHGHPAGDMAGCVCHHDADLGIAADATPTIALAMEMPSFAPCTAALSQPIRETERFHREGGRCAASSMRSASMRCAMEAGPDDREDRANRITDSAGQRD